MSELKSELKRRKLKITDFMFFIETEKRPSYFSNIDNGEYMFKESDLIDFLEIGDLYGKV